MKRIVLAAALTVWCTVLFADNNSYSTRFNISGAGMTTSGIPYILNQNW